MPHSLNIPICPLCLDNINSHSITLPCSHNFCESCILKSYQIRNDCPVCFQEIKKDPKHYPNKKSSISVVHDRSFSRSSRLSDRTDTDKAVLHEFLSLLKKDRQSRIEELELEEKKISSILATLPPIAPQTTNSGLGNKRKQKDILADPVNDRLNKLNENFQSLSNSFSQTKNWDAFASEIIAASKSYGASELASFRNSEGLSAASQIISSIEMSQDNHLFAAAGVLKKINIYSLSAILDSYSSNRSPHTVLDNYPITEIRSQSKISCLSWNPRIKNSLAAADYDGVISCYDSETGKLVSSWTEHEKRCWSVDTSTIDPYRIVSGSDDCKVKLWSQKNRSSVLTLDLRANVCSVRFSPTNLNTIAVGAADHRVFIFDLRKASSPICNEKQHKKSVSYVRFTDDGALLSSSTDCTMRLWRDLENNGTWSTVQVYSGHLNEKNFVGLSIWNDFYATGSEDNSICIYNRSAGGPMIKYQLHTRCPLTRAEMPDEVGTFVSSVCWSGRFDSNGNPVLLAANSTGNIKVLAIEES